MSSSPLKQKKSSHIPTFTFTFINCELVNDMFDSLVLSDCSKLDIILATGENTQAMT